MSSVRLFTAMFFSLCVVCTLAVPAQILSNGVSSGAGEITDEFLPDDRPFDGPLGKGYPSDEVFNNYDLDSEEPDQFLPEDVNDIPQDVGSEHPLRPDDRIPEEKHSDHEPDEEDDQEPPPQENSNGVAETHDDEEEKEDTPDEEEPRTSEDEDSHAVEDEKKLHVDEEEKKIDLPFKPSLFSFQQVNHYIKQLEKAMDHVFKDSLEEAAFMKNSFANTTEEEIEVNGHKYKVEKSIIKTGNEDTNSTLFVEEVSSINEDQPKNRSERSNPDSEPIQ